MDGDTRRFPTRPWTRNTIDAVIPDRPVYVTERDGHMGFANAKALQLAGITAATPDPPNGHIMKGANGEPTGELKETAQRLVRRLIPPESADDRYAALLEHMDEAAAAGITAVQDASTSLDVFPVFERAAAANALKIRFRFATPILPGEGLAPTDHHLTKAPTEDDLATFGGSGTRIAVR